MAESICYFFTRASNRNVVEKLRKAGVRMEETRSKKAGGIFEDRVFVLTGALTHFTRDGAALLIESEGGKVSINVSTKTDYVLVGEKPGSKYRKALDLGVAIMDEDTFISLLEKVKKKDMPKNSQLGMDV